MIISARYNPVCTEGVHDALGAAIAVLAFGLLQWRKAPPWLVVILAAVAGRLIYG